jgi:hypothetical protein
MKYITLFLLLCLLYGCGVHKGQVEKRISELIEENKDSGGCSIILKRITTFKWDTVYFVENSEEVSSIIKMDYPTSGGFKKSVIFLYKGKIVYYENEETGMENLQRGEIIIGDNVNDTSRYKMFVPDSAVFKGSIKMDGEIKYYELVPVNRKPQKQ